VLVILSFVLVLVATVLLVLGLLAEGGLSLIYMSIGCSAAAAVLLFVAVRFARPRQVSLAGASVTIPDLLEPYTSPEPSPVVTPEPALPTAPVTTSPPGDEWQADDHGWDERDDWADADELEFPIADYDDLTAAQIVPLLPKLYSDELIVVEAREREGQARSEVLARIAELRGQAFDVDDAGWEDGEWFPIEDYDSLSIAQIRPLLPQLEEDELEMVRNHEANGPARSAVLGEIDRLLGVEAPPPPAKKPAAKKAAPATKAPVTKRAVPATKATAAKKTTAAKKRT
jgi:hypothetical protein